MITDSQQSDANCGANCGWMGRPRAATPGTSGRLADRCRRRGDRFCCMF